MQTKYVQLAALLMDLEVELRRLLCWDVLPPSVEALQSGEPFCVDTMEFYQWVQWIFIPRLNAMMEAGAGLPTQCDITSMAEVWAASRAFTAREFLQVSRAIDALLSEGESLPD
jgi:uncharacterized protein YqcC (DUF446 family)